MEFDRVVNVDGMIGPDLRSDIDMRFFSAVPVDQREKMWDSVGLNADSSGGRITRRMRNYYYKETGIKLNDGFVTRLGTYIASRVIHRGEYRVRLLSNCDLLHHAMEAQNKNDLVYYGDPIGINTCYGYGGSYHWVVDSMSKDDNAYVMLVYKNESLISRTWVLHFPNLDAYTMFNTYGSIGNYGVFQLFNQAMGGEYSLLDSSEDAESITEDRVFVNPKSTMRIIHKSRWLDIDTDSMLGIYLKRRPPHCSVCGTEAYTITSVRTLGNFCPRCLDSQDILYCEMCGEANPAAECVEVTYVRDSNDGHFDGAMCSYCMDEHSYCESCGGYHI